jgi:hypothetical protein
VAWEEAREYGEEVEENQVVAEPEGVATSRPFGHRVRPNRMTDEEAVQFERDHSQVKHTWPRTHTPRRETPSSPRPLTFSIRR